MAKRIHGGIDFGYELPSSPKPVKSLITQDEDEGYGRFWDRAGKVIEEITPEDLIAECETAKIEENGIKLSDILKESKGKAEKLAVTAFNTVPYVITSQAYATFFSEKIITAMVTIMTAFNIHKGQVLISEGDGSSKSALKKAIGDKSDWISVKQVAPVYPSDIRLLSYYLSEGYEISPEVSPESKGVIIISASEACALFDSMISGKPMTERIITVADAVKKKIGTVLCKTGTKVSDLLKNPDEKKYVIVENGLPAGREAGPDDEINSSTFSLTLAKRLKIRVTECIGCAGCSSICPLYLDPYRIIRNKKSRFSSERAAICIGCKACDFVCPSGIALSDEIMKLAAKNEPEKADDIRKEADNEI